MSCSCLQPSWLQGLMMSLSADADNASEVKHTSHPDLSSYLSPKGGVEPSTKTLIKNGFIYAADTANTVIENGWILVEGQHIKAMGEMSNDLPESDHVVDAGGKLVLPGFVNPHWHESFVAPNHEKPDDSDVMPTAYSNGGNIEALGSMFGFISTVGSKLTLEEGIAIARWSMWTQLRSGTTALGDVALPTKPIQWL
ncbi:amidohydrolase family protein [Veronia nyctiphanis]|uniref:amidohydrolase family protein n=1 Tax=Veronia nyctiphanis TaxID=1278244 RepID=UPI00191C09E9|nr:hypothetical protein [Veronia nyctiphanis]